MFRIGKDRLGSQHKHSPKGKRKKRREKIIYVLDKKIGFFYVFLQKQYSTKMKRTTILAILLTLCFTAFSQEFKFGVRVAFNLCQIDGDATGGYKKGGFNIGALVSYPFSEMFSGQMEINYAAIGARNTVEDQIVNTGYVEIPLLLHFSPTTSLDFGVGVAPSVLVSHTTTENGADVTSIINDINGYRSFTMPGMLDARYWFNPHIGFNVRFAYSLFNIRKDKVSGSTKGIFDYGQYHNVLSFGIIWRT